MKKKVLGVIGGLGPLATTHFMELVISMTEAKTDQENVDMIVYNFPSIPDRTGYILGSNLKSPLPGLTNVALELTRQKVTTIAMPCVTAHYFHRELQSVTSVPILNAVEETVQVLRRHKIQKVGIMATDGTIRAEILTMALENAGMEPVLPSAQAQADVMHLIYENVKAGKPAEMDRFWRVCRQLRSSGAQVILLGCTELSIIKQTQNLGAGFLDVMEVLARKAVLRCGRKLKPQYVNLMEEAEHEHKCADVSGRNSPARAG